MIDEKTINFVLRKYTRNSGKSASKIRDYIRNFEPEFEKYLSTSTMNDIKHLIEKHGIPPSKDIIDSFTSIIIGGKIEGYLIHSIAQDKFWSHKYGIDVSGNLKPEDKYKLFIDGKLDAKFYDYELSDEEKNDPESFRKLAKDNFMTNQDKRKIENEVTTKMQLQNNKSNDKKKDISMPDPGDLLS